MSREEEQLPDLTAFEAALAALTPRVEGFDREQLIFQAGQVLGPAGDDGFEIRLGPLGMAGGVFGDDGRCRALLMMLSTRAAPMVVVRRSTRRQLAPAIADGKARAEPSRASPVDVQPPADHSSDGVAAWLPQWSRAERSAGLGGELNDPAYSLFYPRLREQLLGHGEGAYPREAVASAAPTSISTGPLPYHALLEQLLKK